ncbi:hypothetical protein LTS18_002791 [Coniosporium uncinatum]|uniref:Uncharacterized protein n=1 Tax=Coniosporium uncinatum TaxID=93489 RepID=A0ACC3DYW1_9PEZI|nr:hypothetical protein LTS18_002791 [Coniosporium uncinatum]
MVIYRDSFRTGSSSDEPQSPVEEQYTPQGDIRPPSFETPVAVRQIRAGFSKIRPFQDEDDIAAELVPSHQLAENIVTQASPSQETALRIPSNSDSGSPHFTPLSFGLEETAFTVYADNNDMGFSDPDVNIRRQGVSPYVPVAISTPRRASFTIYTDNNDINFSGRDTEATYPRIYGYVPAVNQATVPSVRYAASSPSPSSRHQAPTHAHDDSSATEVYVPRIPPVGRTPRVIRRATTPLPDSESSPYTSGNSSRANSCNGSGPGESYMHISTSNHSSREVGHPEAEDLSIAIGIQQDASVDSDRSVEDISPEEFLLDAASDPPSPSPKSEATLDPDTVLLSIEDTTNIPPHYSDEGDNTSTYGEEEIERDGASNEEEESVDWSKFAQVNLPADFTLVNLLNPTLYPTNGRLAQPAEAIATNNDAMDLFTLAEHLRRPTTPYADQESVLYPLSEEAILERGCMTEDFNTVSWRTLITGGDRLHSKPRLSFAKSEDRACSELGEEVTQATIKWDVDSVLFLTTTLAVFRGGFNFSYYPPYLYGLRQNPRVTFGGRNPHKIKNMRIGSGTIAAGYRYTCHVCFPELQATASGEIHLSDAHQEVWIDQIVIPALRRTYPPDVFDSHPFTFKEVRAKARVGREAAVTIEQAAEQVGASTIDMKFFLPAEGLEPFWSTVVRLCQRVNPPDSRVGVHDFRAPILVVSSHDLKSHLRQDSFGDVQSLFTNHLERLFVLDRRDWIPEGIHCDLGVECRPTVPGITLLNKSHCLRTWAGLFDCPMSRTSRTKRTFFTWNNTRDAGSASVELAPSNTLQVVGGLIYHKAYNKIIRLHQTPFKKYGPFDNPQFEALAYSQELIDQWYTTARARGAPGASAKRAQLLLGLQRTRLRISEILTGHPISHPLGEVADDIRQRRRQSSWAIRREFRLRLSVFQQLSELPNVSLDREQSHPVEEDILVRHRPYWVCLTTDVLDLWAADINRWLFAAEVLISRATDGPPGSGRLACSTEEQLVNGAMLAAVLRIIRMSFSGDVAKYPSI